MTTPITTMFEQTIPPMHEKRLKPAVATIDDDSFIVIGGNIGNGVSLDEKKNISPPVKFTMDVATNGLLFPNTCLKVVVHVVLQRLVDTYI